MTMEGRNGLARYKMSTCPRGLCLIINNKNFKNPEYNREGAQKDEEDLNSLFKKLHFTVYVKNDLTRGEMEDVAKEFGGKDYGNFDAFVFIIMSHGGKKDVIFGVDEKKTSIKDLTSEFRSDCCPTLKGKPKLVIIQSCRGSHTDVSYRSVDASPTVDSTLVKGVFPKEADFLFAFSTPPDYVAYRYDSGSPFIQGLVSTIGDLHCNYHLLDILTEVIKRVIEKGEEEGKEKVQVPAVTHTLRKQLWLGELQMYCSKSSKVHFL